MEIFILKVLIVTILVSLIGYSGWLYIKNIRTAKIEPTNGTWILFSVATFLSVSSISVATEGKFFSNALSFADSLQCWAIMIILEKKTRVRLKKFEWIYLSIAVVIIAFWYFSRNAFITNLLVQSLIAVGYFPTIHKIIKEKESKESIKNWMLFMIIGAIGLIIPIMEENTLSIIYGVRTIVITSFIIFLTKKYPRRNL